MATSVRKSATPAGGAALTKTPTGIAGLDEITAGGIPQGRPTLICGGAGCGKTMLAGEILVRGALQYKEPGVFMMFEESAAELAVNMRSMVFDLNALLRARKLALDFVYIDADKEAYDMYYEHLCPFVRAGGLILFDNTLRGGELSDPSLRNKPITRCRVMPLRNVPFGAGV